MRSEKKSGDKFTRPVWNKVPGHSEKWVQDRRKVSKVTFGLLALAGLSGCVGISPVFSTPTDANTFEKLLDTATPQSTSTTGPTATPEPTVTPEPTATPVPTDTPEPTPTVGLRPLELVEFDRLTLDLFGRKVEFVIGTDKISDIGPTWERWGIEALVVNPNLENPEEHYGKMMEALFWAISEAEDGSLPTIEEFLANPGGYDITIPTKIPGTVARKGSVTFKPSEINQIVFAYVDNNDKEKIFSGPYNQHGYRYKNGVLTVFTTTLPDDQNLDWCFFENNSCAPGGRLGLEQTMGDFFGSKLFPGLLFLSRHDYMETLSFVRKYSDYPYQIKGRESEYFNISVKKGFWKLIYQ